jgi:hypothetical protein
LGADPDIETVGLQMHRRVERLHGDVSKQRSLIQRVMDAARAREHADGVALFLGLGHWSVQRVAIKLTELRAVGARGGAAIPGDLQRIERGLRAPIGIGHHGDGLRHANDAHDAATSPDRGLVDVDELPAEDRAGLHRRIDHVRQAGIDAVFRGAIELHRRVETRQGFADQREAAELLDRRLAVECDLRRFRGKLAIGERSAAGAMQHRAVRRGALGDGNVPLPRRGGDQALARAGARLLQPLPRSGDPAAANRIHVAIDGVLTLIARGGGEFALDLRPVDLQLLGDDLRQRGRGALPHLRMRDADGDGLVGIDHDPGGDLTRRRRLRAPRLGAERQRLGHVRIEYAEREASAGAQGGDDELAARQRLAQRVELAHEFLPPLSLSSRRPRDGWRGGCGHRCRSGRYW